jgi:hypothetical protein
VKDRERRKRGREGEERELATEGKGERDIKRRKEGGVDT